VLALKREGYRKGDFDMKEVAAMMAYPGLWRMAAKQWRYAIGEFQSLNTECVHARLATARAGGHGI
jgi:hypothetical protein